MHSIMSPIVIQNRWTALPWRHLENSPNRWIQVSPANGRTHRHQTQHKLWWAANLHCFLKWFAHTHVVVNRGKLEDILWGFVSSFNCGEPKDPTQGCAWHKELLPIEPSWWSPPLHYSCSRRSHRLHVWDHQPHPTEGMWRGSSFEGVRVVTDEGKLRTNRWKTEDTNVPNTMWDPGLNSRPDKGQPEVPLLFKGMCS